ncbi:MAG: OmpA family protein [Xanthomonadaceae bacterium]|nr:OmpA family protein [Xanthomonadaceae bacterium]MDE1886061.1 OmpA family protein [Xanthomonadaceae bacterium]MDE2257100.1 OmpA family protein [Xanthomonadaceae bacterium]
MSARTAAGIILALAAFAALAAKPDLDYERLRASLDSLAADPALGKLAPGERGLAEQAVQALATDHSGGKDARAFRVYMAERRVDIAYAAAQVANQQNKLDELGREHDRILLQAAQREAEQARAEAEKQRLQSMIRAEEVERLRAEGAQSAQEAQAAQAQADQAQKLIAAQAKATELAHKEAQLAEAANADLRRRLNNLTATRGAEGMQMTLDDIAFAPGRANLRPAAKASLGKLIAFVNRDPSKPIRIEGHTDSSGNTHANLVLSQRRADAVRDALVAAGVAANRITAIGMGESQPVADNGTEAGRARNRRVDVILQDK